MKPEPPGAAFFAWSRLNVAPGPRTSGAGAGAGPEKVAAPQHWFYSAAFLQASSQSGIICLDGQASHHMHACPHMTHRLTSMHGGMALLCLFAVFQLTFFFTCKLTPFLVQNIQAG